MSQEPSHACLEQSAASDESLQSVHAQLLKVKPERPRGYSPLPLFVLGAMCSAVFFGSIYLVHYSGGFDPLVYNETIRPPKGGAAAAVVQITPAQLGKRVFLNTCIACHQANGLGVPGQYPPLAGSDWVAGSEERIIRVVLHGFNGPVTVSGKDFNNAMAPLGALLKDEQIANVLSYVRSEWGNNSPEVKPETVAKVRAETASRSTPWTAVELLKIGQ